MAVGYIVLGYLAVVFSRPLVQKMGFVCFLQKGVALVFFIGENTLYCAYIPAFLSAGGEKFASV